MRTNIPSHASIGRILFLAWEKTSSLDIKLCWASTCQLTVHQTEHNCTMGYWKFQECQTTWWPWSTKDLITASLNGTSETFSTQAHAWRPVYRDPIRIGRNRVDKTCTCQHNYSMYLATELTPDWISLGQTCSQRPKWQMSNRGCVE